MVAKGERSVYLCDLSTIMNGPSEQNLSQVSRLFDIEDKEVDFTGGNLVALGKNNLAILREVGQTTFVDWFHFKIDAIHTEGEIARFTQPESTEVEGELPDPYNLSYKILPNNMLALGVAGAIIPQPTDGRETESITLMMFQYNHVTNQVVRLTTQKIDIDIYLLSKLPCSTTQNEEIKLNFGICKGRIFCVAQIHSEKPVLQVFCYYRNMFQPIGGTNCRRAGVYVMDRNTKVGLDPESCMPSFNYPNEGLKELYVTSCKVDYDFKQRLATFKFCEWALRF